MEFEAVPTVVEEFTNKPLTKKERNLKKIKKKLVKENRLYLENIDDPKEKLGKAMEQFSVDPRAGGPDLDNAQNRFIEWLAQTQYEGIRKAKLVKPVKPKKAKIVKPRPEKAMKSKPRPEKALKPKPVKVVKQKPVKVVKQKVVKPKKPSRASIVYNLLYQKFLALTNQELAAEFILNQFTGPEEKPKYWCTICETKFAKLSGLNRHFKRHTSKSYSAPSTSPEPSSSADASISECSPLSPDDLMVIDITEGSDEGSLE